MIHNFGTLRRVVLPLLKATAIDVTVAHHWVPAARLKLNSYLHKGYWYHGRQRESDTMTLFAELVETGNRLIEVGGHIGYITIYFSHLVGAGGRVDVFEPGSNNLPYIRANIESFLATKKHQIRLIEAAVGSQPGTATFYEDGLTGQNNSLVKNFATLNSNAQAANAKVSVKTREVDVVTLDAHVGDEPIDFVKVDVEGFEWGVVQGMSSLLTNQKPIIMVELTMHASEIRDKLTEHGYRLFRPDRTEVGVLDELVDNTFALHRNKHAALIERRFKTS